MPFESFEPLLPEILELQAKWRSQQVVAQCRDRQLTWTQFEQSTCRIANWLHTSGLHKGDRVAVTMQNGLPMLQVLFGILRAGMVSVPINLTVSDEAIFSMLSDSGSSMIIATPDQATRLDHAGLSARFPSLHRMFSATATGVSTPDVSTPDVSTPDAVAPEGWADLHGQVQDSPQHRPEVEIRPEDPLNIIYSSGTTGQPKGIVHTQRTRLNFARDLAIALRYQGQVRTLVTIGMYSNISWVSMLCTLLVGGKLVIQPRFDPDQVLDDIQHHRITHSSMVPVQYQRMWRSHKQRPRDLSSLRAPMSCGSSLPAGIKSEMIESGVPIIELYGLTEGPITTIGPEEGRVRPGSVGRPVIGSDILILDDEDRVAGPDQAGEIAGRCRFNMHGYYHREEATESAVWLDDRGRQWLRTGDIGKVDRDGFLTIVGRKKDMIISGGQNIYPEDLEAVMLQHDAVADAAVIGIKSEAWGETPLGLVVPEPGLVAEPVELLEWCNRRLGKRQRLYRIDLLESLPRNPNGKILKRDLRKRYEREIV